MAREPRAMADGPLGHATLPVADDGAPPRHGPLDHTTLPPKSLAQTAQKAALTTRQQGGGASTVARRGQIARLHKEGAGRRRRLAAPTQQVRRPWLRSPELQRAAARVVRQFHTRIPPWRCKAVELARRLRACTLNSEAISRMKTAIFKIITASFGITP